MGLKPIRALEFSITLLAEQGDVDSFDGSRRMDRFILYMRTESFLGRELSVAVAAAVLRDSGRSLASCSLVMTL